MARSLGVLGSIGLSFDSSRSRLELRLIRGDVWNLLVWRAPVVVMSHVLTGRALIGQGAVSSRHSGAVVIGCRVCYTRMDGVPVHLAGRSLMIGTRIVGRRRIRDSHTARDPGWAARDHRVCCLPKNFRQWWTPTRWEHECPQLVFGLLV